MKNISYYFVFKINYAIEVIKLLKCTIITYMVWTCRQQSRSCRNARYLDAVEIIKIVVNILKVLPRRFLLVLSCFGNGNLEKLTCQSQPTWRLLSYSTVLSKAFPQIQRGEIYLVSGITGIFKEQKFMQKRN